MIAVTGATGLLGAHIVRQLVKDNIPFIALKREGSDTALLDDLKDCITWRNADVSDALRIHEALQGCSAVIHSAAIVSFNQRRAGELEEVNVNGTKNVVNACLENGVRRLIHISSVSALGRQKGETIIREDHKWVDNPLNNIYAISKYQAELEVFRGQEEGLSTIILNPSLILAPSDWTKSSARLFRYVWKKRPFYFDACMNYVDVRDVATCAIRFVNLNHEAQRIIINAGSVSFISFFKKVAANFQVPPPWIKLSKSTLNLLAKLESARTFFSKSEPLVSREAVQLAGSQFLYDNEKVKNILDFEFQTIDNTVDWCCAYYKRTFNSKK
jgi:nucleoside-diphosphate-sugar epimerase